MIVAVPEDDLTEEQIEALELENITLGMFVTGTKSYFNRTPLIILTRFNKGEMTAFFNEHNLDWKVLITEKSKQAQAKLLKYFNKIPVYDDDGNQTGEESITDLKGRLHTIAGHSWDFE